MNFITDNIATIIVIVLVCLGLFFAIKKLIKNKKDGKCSCGCETCSYKDNCHKK